MQRRVKCWSDASWAEQGYRTNQKTTLRTGVLIASKGTTQHYVPNGSWQTRELITTSLFPVFSTFTKQRRMAGCAAMPPGSRPSFSHVQRSVFSATHSPSFSPNPNGANAVLCAFCFDRTAAELIPGDLALNRRFSSHFHAFNPAHGSD